VERNYFYIGTPNHQESTIRKAGKKYSQLVSKKLIEKSEDAKNPCRVRFFVHFLNMERADAHFSVLLRLDSKNYTNIFLHKIIYRLIRCYKNSYL
jgi:hypothetical protein